MEYKTLKDLKEMNSALKEMNSIVEIRGNENVVDKIKKFFPVAQEPQTSQSLFGIRIVKDDRVPENKAVGLNTKHEIVQIFDFSNEDEPV